MTFYNEIDKGAAEWLRRLMTRGLIAPGVVDERSIADLDPATLTAATRVHLFAGIGGWDLALRLAGWPDGIPVWTGSCPCQPFSKAGKGGGVDDPRHLWPEMFRLIKGARPPFVFGEQVPSPAGRAWCRGVRADLEGAGYHFDALALLAAGVGAPHIRERIYWGGVRLPDADGERGNSGGATARSEAGTGAGAGECGAVGRLGDADGPRAGRYARAGSCAQVEGHRARLRDGGQRHAPLAPGSDAVRLGDAHCAGRQGRGAGVRGGPVDRGVCGPAASPGSAGFWRDFDVLPFRDGKARRVESGSFPLAHGLPLSLGRGEPGFRRLVRSARGNRAVRLRGYGNAIVPELAAVFVRAFIEEVT